MPAFRRTVKTLFQSLIYPLSMMLLISCEDREAPSIDIITPHAGAILRRDVKIEISAQDNEDIQSIKLYLNDSLFHEFTGEPYIVTWKTQDFENGIYDLKGKATDANGNETLSKSVEVTVANTLVTAIFSRNWICNDCDQGVIFVTALDGTLLGQANWTGNDTVRMPATYTTRPDTGRINVTTLRNDGLGNILVTTYLDIPSGVRLKYKGLPRVFLNDYEYMRFYMTNIPSHSGWSISNGFSDTWSYPDSMGINVNVRNYMDEVSVYLQLANTSSGTRYLWLENQISGSITLDLSTLSQTSSRVIQFPPGGGGQARSILTGYRSLGSYYDAAYLLDRQRIYNFSSNTMTVHPPPSLMADYKTYMYYFDAGGWYYNTVFGAIPEAFNKLEADLNFISNNKNGFEVSTSGNFDQIKSLWRHAISSGTVEWNVYGPPELTAYSLPYLPSLAGQLFPRVVREQLVLISADLADYPELGSYDEVLEIRFGTEGYFNEYVHESLTRSKTY